MFVDESFHFRTAGSRATQQRLFSLLQSCGTLKKLTQIHAQVLVNGFSQKNFILVKLLSFYIASGNVSYAEKILEDIQNPSTTAWNQMIRGMPRRSIELFKQMVAEEVEPDGFTYSFVLSACARMGLLREGEQVHGRVLTNGHRSNVFIQTNLVNLYARGEQNYGLTSARKVFDDMGHRNIVSWNSLLAGYIRHRNIERAIRVFDEMPERNVVTWTNMIAGCAQNGKCKQALSLFSEMQRTAVGLDQLALIAALSACAELGDLKLGRQIHFCIEQKLCFKGQPILVTLSNALIHMYASCGRTEEAYEIFKRLQSRTTVSWTSMITAFAKQGRAEEALHLFQQMLNSGEKEVKPDEITLIGVLCACSHAGFVNEGRQLFESMSQTWGIKPKIEHYGCMVDMYSRGGFLDEACKLVERMPMKANDVVWGALLGGCRIYKNSKLASDVAQKLTAELEPERAAGYLVLLSNVYAIDKRWKDVASMRQKMVEMGVKKPAGRSWVQIKGVVHDFIAGDRTHKNSSKIYEMLGEVTMQAKREGYKPDIQLDVAE